MKDSIRDDINFFAPFIGAFAIICAVIILTGYLIKQGPVSGIVVEKHFTEAHIEQSFMIVNNTMVPTTTYTPESYSITVIHNNKHIQFNTTKEIYQSINVGDFFEPNKQR